jgi:predicted transcriptional regulator
MITPAQIRAARALLGWKQVDLAKAAGLSALAVKGAEGGRTDPRTSTLNAIERAIEEAGVKFLDAGDASTGPGVCLKPSRTRRRVKQP